MTDTYVARKSELTAYFDRTAAEAWKALTSDTKVSRIRETVRAGRDRMRATLLSWLPADLAGRRLLDAGCGTGALAAEAAGRGAAVVAVDISASLIATARERVEPHGRISFLVGDMLDDGLGAFDHAVAMDSLIHYEPADVVRALTRLAPRVRGSIVFTFAPRTPALTLMHAAGRLFPRGDRAPAIVPVSPARLTRAITAEPGLSAFAIGRTLRITSGFYTSQALELVRR